MHRKPQFVEHLERPSFLSMAEMPRCPARAAKPHEGYRSNTDWPQGQAPEPGWIKVHQAAGHGSTQPLPSHPRSTFFCPVQAGYTKGFIYRTSKSSLTTVHTLCTCVHTAASAVCARTRTTARCAGTRCSRSCWPDSSGAASACHLTFQLTMPLYLFLQPVSNSSLSSHRLISVVWSLSSCSHSLGFAWYSLAQ